MSCLYCTKKQTDYSYSGADTVNIDVVFDGTMVFSQNDGAYLRAEIVFCKGCNGAWFLDYFYPDHPPMTVGARYVSHELLNSMYQSRGKTRPFMEAVFSEWLEFGFFDWYPKAFPSLVDQDPQSPK